MTEGAESERKSASPVIATALLGLLLTLFVGGGLFSGWIFLATVRELLAGSPPASARQLIDEIPITIGGGVVRVVVRPTATTAPPLPTPTAVPDDPPPVWDGRDRVTILLLGIDQREDEKGLPTRSDTMILISMDPQNLTGSMLSLPRDLWVPIQGHGQGKLNSAHFYGELDRPGNGPQMARRTVEYNIGVRINYVARVDFRGFERLIDALGGVTVDVDRAILDDEYPNEKYGITRLFIPPGPQRMNGPTALRYARTRHADSDFGRIRRQQRVLQAAREEAMTLGIVPKLPSMVGIINSAIVTDIPFADMWALANLGRQIPGGGITSRHVDDSMVIDANNDGSVLVPDRERIRKVVQELFYDPAIKKEAARIEVLNGTTREGAATGLRTALQGQSFTVVAVDTANRTDHRETIIVDRRNKRATTARLASLLGVPARNVRTESATGAAQADVTVTIGSDFKPIS